jgi:hypothetical protein
MISKSIHACLPYLVVNFVCDLTDLLHENPIWFSVRTFPKPLIPSNNILCHRLKKYFCLYNYSFSYQMSTKLRLNLGGYIQLVSKDSKLEIYQYIMLDKGFDKNINMRRSERKP